MATNKGLLFVFGDVGEDVSEDEFNDWYNNEHAPARLTVPGVQNALRYKASDDQHPTYIAMYDATSPLTFQSDEYKSLGPQASQRERALIPKLKILNRRIYEQLAVTSKNNEDPKAPAKFIQVVTAFVEEDELKSMEQITLARSRQFETTVPGWLRTRFYKLVSIVELGCGSDIDPTPTNYLIMHDFDSPDFATSKFLETLYGETETPSLKVRNFYLCKEIK